MSKILKNQTGSPITISDVGVTLPASPATYTIPPQDYLLWADSSDIVTEVGAGNVVVNDGSQDLSISDGTSLLKGYYPHELIGATDGTPIGNIDDALKVVGSSDYNNPMIIDFTNEHHDAFARLRVSQPTTLFSDAFTYNSHFDEHWDTSVVGTGSVVHDATTGQRLLKTNGTATGAKAILQTRRRIQYVKGKSQLIYQTGSFNALQANVRKRLGYFDESNGVYFESDGTDLYVVRRTSVSGSVVDNRTISTSWNIDQFDGTGPSGEIADPTKHYLFIIDFSWLGSNIIRYGIISGGNIHYVHQENTSGELTLPWMLSAHLPLRYEIENTGTAAAIDQLDITCMTVISEGGQTNLGHVHTVDTGVTSLTVNATATAYAGVRLKTTSLNAALKALSFDIFPVSGNSTLYWRIIYNGTLTTPTWGSVTNLSEGLTNAPVYTEGTGFVIDSGYIDLGGGGGKDKGGTFSSDVESDIYAGFDIAGTADTVTLVCRTVSSNGEILFSGSFREFY